MVVRLTEQVNPHFYKLWKTKKPYIIAKGGRGSFKSSVVSLKVVSEMAREIEVGHVANVVCIRENATYLRDTIYNQILWAIGILGLTGEFRARTSPLTITHKATGSTFYFYGANDPMKLKSNTVQNVIAVWYEEAANFQGVDVFDQANPTFIRQKSPFIDQVQVFYTYNPPRNPYSWVNEWVESKKDNPNYFIDTSTYLDDKLGFTTDQQLELIEEYKQNDYDYYSWLYLGEVIGLGTNVYNMQLFHAIDAIPDNERLMALYYSADTGHEISATTCGAYALSNKGNVYLLDTYYYSPVGKANKKSPSELSTDLYKFINDVGRRYDMPPSRLTIDSAEGALDNQFYQDYGVHWHKVNKLKKVNMIDRVQDLLAQGRFYYLNTENNQIFIKEHQRYEWDQDTIESDNPKVIKVNDHTVDNFQYVCLDNERDFGLRF